MEFGFGGTAKNELHEWLYITSRYDIPRQLPTLPLVTIPEPRILSLQDKEEDILAHVAKLYLTATKGYRKNLGETFRKSILQQSLYLQCHNIAPARWLAFILSFWPQILEQNGDLPKLAPPNWVFSIKNFQRYQSWFLDEAPGLCTPKSYHTKSAVELAVRFAKLRRQILLGDDPDIVLQKYLPDNLWNTLPAKAIEETKHEQAEINRKVHEGVYLW